MNMSYCRFHNTRMDLADCVEALENFDDISEEEMLHAEMMYNLCERYMQAYIEFKENLEN